MNKDILDFFYNINFNNIDIKYKYFDLVLSGGGFKSFYHIGLCKILKELEYNDKIKIRNIIGTSSGAISAVIYACNIDFDIWFEAYYDIKDNINNSDLHRAVIKTLKNKLPNDAYLKCNNKVKISVSKLTMFGFYEETIDYFTSNDHLISVISASIKIPFLTSNSIIGQKINNSFCYDGFFSRISPVIHNNDLPQLLVRTQKVIYSHNLIFKPADSYIELLSLRGLYESKKFLKNEIVNKIMCWIPPNKSKKIKNKLYIIVPIIFYFIPKFL